MLAVGWVKYFLFQCKDYLCNDNVFVEIDCVVCCLQSLTDGLHTSDKWSTHSVSEAPKRVDILVKT